MSEWSFKPEAVNAFVDAINLNNVNNLSLDKLKKLNAIFDRAEEELKKGGSDDEAKD